MSQVQILRRGADTWDLTRVTEVWRGAHEYELIGRVVRDGDFYYVEIPRWKKEGFEWERQPRAYQVPRGGWRALIDAVAKVLQ